MKRTIIGAALAVAAIAGAAPADANPVPSYPNCDVVPWGFLGSQRRLICDDVMHGNTWQRRRIVFTPAHQVPITTNCYGGSYSTSCSTYGGYWVDLTVTDDQTYPVTPDTVLPDEPGYLGPAPVV